MHLNLFRTKQATLRYAPSDITALWLFKCVKSCQTQEQLDTCKQMVWNYLVARYEYQKIAPYRKNLMDLIRTKKTLLAA